jgi:hypothetical protein
MVEMAPVDLLLFADVAAVTAAEVAGCRGGRSGGVLADIEDTGVVAELLLLSRERGSPSAVVLLEYGGDVLVALGDFWEWIQLFS